MNNKALFKIGYGLYVLTAREQGLDNGCIVNTVMQVTQNPLQIAVAVNKLNHTHDMIRRTGLFNVSVLTEKTPFSTFQRFGFQSGKNVDKFADYPAEDRSANGLRFIKEAANAVFSAKVNREIDMGSHTLFIADVTDAEVLSDEPSVTYTYYQQNIKPQPAAPKGVKGWRCRICGYVYEGAVLPPDFICPWCKHGAADFEPIE